MKYSVRQIYLLGILGLSFVQLGCSTVTPNATTADDTMHPNVAQYDPVYFSGQLALAEFEQDSNLKLRPVPDFILRTAGKIRGMQRSYAKTYASIYLTLWNKSPHNRTFPVVTFEPGSESYSSQLTRAQRLLELAYWLSHNIGDEIYNNYTVIARQASIDYQSGSYADFSAALESSVSAYYRVNIDMNVVSAYFFLAMKYSEIDSSGRMALADFEFEHDITILGIPNVFLRTAGSLRLMDCSNAESYADMYLSWLSRSPSNKLFPVVTFEPGGESYSRQLTRMQIALEMAYWLNHRLGDRVYRDYTDVVQQAASNYQSGQYHDFFAALQSSVKSRYGIHANMEIVRAYFSKEIAKQELSPAPMDKVDVYLSPITNDH